MSRDSRARRAADPGRVTTNLFSPLSCWRRFLAGRSQLLGVVATACLLIGCGVQGPPKPPRVERPERVTNLTATQVGRVLGLRFALPQRATDGERLTKPLEIQILRHVAAAGTPPSEASALTPWLTLLPNQWSQYARGEEIVVPAPLSEQEFRLWQGATLSLAVRTLTRGFRHRPLESEPSNLIRIPLIDVSVPVESLACQTTEKANELTWKPPPRSLTGQPLRDLAGYRVYRSRTGKPDSFELRGEISTPPYLDRDFEFGRTYFYKVRAMFQQAGKTAEGEDSPVEEVTPRDVFPPAAPADLTGVYAAGAVELVWTANSEADLAGYSVYRREGQGPPKRLNPELQRTPIFRDASVEPGRTYSYRVTAVDLSNNESPPSEEVLVETK